MTSDTGQQAPLSTCSTLLKAEHRIQSSLDASVFLHLRERVLKKPTVKNSIPLLLVHGATIPSVLWDNPLPSWSWMDQLAEDGFHVYAVDLRGYGRSSRPASFTQPPASNPPYARAMDVIQDVVDAIDFILQKTGADKVDLFGGSWGSIICGKLIAENPFALVRRLILYAPLYCETDSHPSWLNVDLTTDPQHAHSNHIGAFRQVNIEALESRWDSEIPVEDKSTWRPKGVLEALVSSCLCDEKHFCKEEDGQLDFRVPNGTLVDLQAVYRGIPLYDCKAIKLPTLLIRGSADPVSTHEDATRLFESLTCDVKRYTVIGNGAHFMIAENKMGEVHSSVTGFLRENL